MAQQTPLANTLLEQWRLNTRVFNGDRYHDSNLGMSCWRTVQEFKPVEGGGGRVSVEQCVSGLAANGVTVRAVKAIHKRGEAFKKSWQRELEALITFSDKSLQEYESLFVQFLGWFEDDHFLNIAMEYVQFGDLQGYIRRPFIAEREAAVITKQVAQALQYMHRKGFVHRDLKPQNILVVSPGASWHVKVADFGICKNVESSVLDTSCGTPGYWAPEQVDGSTGSYTSAVDIFALGAVVFCMRTGAPPFPTPFSLYEYVKDNSKFPTEPLDLSTSLCERFILRAMEPKPEKRLSIADALTHPWLTKTLAINEENTMGSQSNLHLGSKLWTSISSQQESSPWSHLSTAPPQIPVQGAPTPMNTYGNTLLSHGSQQHFPQTDPASATSVPQTRVNQAPRSQTNPFRVSAGSSTFSGQLQTNPFRVSAGSSIFSGQLHKSTNTTDRKGASENQQEQLQTQRSPSFIASTSDHVPGQAHAGANLPGFSQPYNRPGTAASGVANVPATASLIPFPNLDSSSAFSPSTRSFVPEISSIDHGSDHQTNMTAEQWTYRPQPPDLQTVVVPQPSGYSPRPAFSRLQTDPSSLTTSMVPATLPTRFSDPTGDHRAVQQPQSGRSEPNSSQRLITDEASLQATIEAAVRKHAEASFRQEREERLKNQQEREELQRRIAELELQTRSYRDLAEASGTHQQQGSTRMTLSQAPTPQALYPSARQPQKQEETLSRNRRQGNLEVDDANSVHGALSSSAVSLSAMGSDGQLRPVSRADRPAFVSSPANYVYPEQGYPEQFASLAANNTFLFNNEKKAPEPAEMIDPSQTCLACLTIFDTREDLFHHLSREPSHQRRPAAITTAPMHPFQPDVDPYLTCLTCKQPFGHRSNLFDHLELMRHAIDPKTGIAEPWYKRPAASRERDKAHGLTAWQKPQRDSWADRPNKASQRTAWSPPSVQPQRVELQWMQEQAPMNKKSRWRLKLPGRSR